MELQEIYNVPLDHPDARKPASQFLRPLLNVAIAFIVIDTAFLIGRFVAVLFLRKKRLPLTWDDYLLVPAFFCTIGICINAFLMIHYETIGDPDGHRLIIPQLDQARLVPLLKCIYAILELLLPAYALTRYSVLAIYLRLFSGKWVRLGSYAMILLITLQWLGFAIASVIQCTPLNYYWDRTVPGGRCVDINRFYRSFTPVNIAADVLIILLPLPRIWKLDVSRTRKFGITLIFGIGLIALAASVVRAIEFETRTSEEIAPNHTAPLISWLIIEPSLYFITACLPAMHPLFRLFVPTFIRNRTNQKLAANRASHHPDQANSNMRKRRLAPGGGMAGGASFTRLVEPSDKDIFSGGAMGGSKAQRLNKEAGIEMSPRQGSGPMPLEDMRRVEMGGGIMVQTEIMVTEEERIGEVLGF